MSSRKSKKWRRKQKGGGQRQTHQNKPQGVRMKVEAVEAGQQLGRLRSLAEEYGIEIQENVLRCGPVARTLHWMFDCRSVRLLDYWPGTGRYYCRLEDSKGRVDSASEALTLAMQILRRNISKLGQEYEWFADDACLTAHLRSIGRQTM